MDTINALFELFGGLFIFTSVLKLYKQKMVRGISLIHISFFLVWGYWNLAYYPSLDQWYSFAGGLFIATMNTVFAGMMLYYILKEKHELVSDNQQEVGSN